MIIKMFYIYILCEKEKYQPPEEVQYDNVVSVFNKSVGFGICYSI
jgi:hypothetical protein